MTAFELATMNEEDLKSMTVEERKNISRQAWQAYSTVGDHPKYNYINPNTGEVDNILRHLAETADMLNDLATATA